MATSPQTEPISQPAGVSLWFDRTHGRNGYTISGGLTGPTLAVYGRPEDVAEAYERLVALPGLSRLRGSLILAFGAPDDTFEVDALIDLSSSVLSARTRIAHNNYWTILSHCADLGMISGRGVTQRSRRAQPVLQSGLAARPAVKVWQHS